MLNSELIKKLRRYPLDLEVMVEVHNNQAPATDVDWETGGVSTWLVITDYPVPEDAINSRSN